MFNKKLSMDSFSNLIAEGTTVNGIVQFAGALKIQGKVVGESISSISDLELKKPARDCIIVDVIGIVQSEDMRANDFIIAGTVTSKRIWAEDTVRILKSATITGALIYYRTLEIEPGATIHNCQLKHLDKSSEGETL
jgi:cytoskeletal protein CcmA (bactofilin family)